MRWKHGTKPSCLVAVAVGSCLWLAVSGSAAADDKLVPFSFENHDVNHAITSLYESQPAIWGTEQLYLVGLCYVAEKKLDQAQALFETLHKRDPSHARVLRALGNVNHMKGENAAAERCYRQAWSEGQDVTSLKQLAVLKLQTKDMEGLAELIDDLVKNQEESLGIQKVLLTYSLMVSDVEVGGRIYESVVRKMSKDVVEQNADLRKLLLMVTARYRQAGDAKPSSDVPQASGDASRGGSPGN